MSTPTTEKTAKPKNTMSRDYIVQRLEARIASIKSRVAEGERILSEFVEEQDANVRAITALNIGKIGAANKAASDIGRRFANAKTPGERRKIAHELTKLVTLDSLPDWPTRYYEQNRNRAAGDWSGVSGDALIAVIQKDIIELQGELYQLEHSLAYLRESPMEEFTITALSRLGLMDAVKFALTPEAAARRR